MILLVYQTLKNNLYEGGEILAEYDEDSYSPGANRGLYYMSSTKGLTA